MKKDKFPRSYDFDNGQSVDIEDILKSSLHPVNPRSDYVHDLKDKLHRVTPRPKFVLPKRFQYVVLGIVGFISGIVLLLAGIRAITTFLATMGILRYVNREQHERKLQESGVIT